ncbi:hypothetical protein L1887_43370 [Cichorium endivia]|nr:hypothetical protein L1887_43370 [Cichorium endivia]
MTEQETIYQEVCGLLTRLFEIDPQDITPEARLYEDLELDSIDAVDMIVHLQKKTASARRVKRRAWWTDVPGHPTADGADAAGVALPDWIWANSQQPAVAVAGDGAGIAAAAAPGAAERWPDAVCGAVRGARGHCALRGKLPAENPPVAAVLPGGRQPCDAGRVWRFAVDRDAAGRTAGALARARFAPGGRALYPQGDPRLVRLFHRKRRDGAVHRAPRRHASVDAVERYGGLHPDGNADGDRVAGAPAGDKKRDAQ